jgi:twitching motility protein PilU
LFNLYEARRISYETAIRHADSVNNLRLRIKLESQRPQPKVASDGPLQIEEDRRR